MKKIVLVLWTFVMMLLLGGCIWYYLCKKSEVSGLKTYAVDVDFSVTLFDSLAQLEPYTLLVVTSEGCNVCDLVREESVLATLPLTTCFLEREASPANLLVAQSLATRSFPTSYLFDREQHLLGYFKGVADFGEQLEGLVEGACMVAEDTLAMFDNAFRALQASFGYDAEELLRHAWASVDCQPYFFNHYLLYDYYRQVQLPDSAEYYKQQALACLQGADVFVFESLIRQMEPGYPLLKWVDRGFGMDSTLNE